MVLPDRVVDVAGGGAAGWVWAHFGLAMFGVNLAGFVARRVARARGVTITRTVVHQQPFIDAWIQDRKEAEEARRREEARRKAEDEARARAFAAEQARLLNEKRARELAEMRRTHWTCEHDRFVPNGQECTHVECKHGYIVDSPTATCRHSSSRTPWLEGIPEDEYFFPGGK